MQILSYDPKDAGRAYTIYSIERYNYRGDWSSVKLFAHRKRAEGFLKVCNPASDFRIVEEILFI